MDAMAGVRIEQIVKKKYLVKRGESIYTVARNLDISVFELKRINRLRSNRLKRGKLLYYFEKEWVDVGMANPSLKVQANHDELYSFKSKNKKRVKYHRVRQGDTLSQIASRYGGISIEKIKKLNRLRSSVLRPGMKLRISS
jgi:membrane-bound lytic murein transglycosylase D